MKKNTLLVASLFVSLIAALVGCSHGKTKLNSVENRVVKDGVVSLSASSMRDKKNKYEVNFVIGNESGKNIIVVLNDLACFKGSAQGSVSHASYGNGVKMVDFQPGEVRNFRLICTLAAMTDGKPRVVVKKVYANPSGDGLRIGAVLVENAEWTLSDAEKAAPKAESTVKSEPVKTMPAVEPVKTESGN